LPVPEVAVWGRGKRGDELSVGGGGKGANAKKIPYKEREKTTTQRSREGRIKREEFVALAK